MAWDPQKTNATQFRSITSRHWQPAGLARNYDRLSLMILSSFSTVFLPSSTNGLSLLNVPQHNGICNIAHKASSPQEQGKGETKQP